MRIAVAGSTGRVGRHVVDVLITKGHKVIPISRTDGVDVISGKGLQEALAGVEVIVDAVSIASPEQKAATEFFLTATHNLQQAGRTAGVRRIVMVSIIGIEKFAGGYMAAKVAHEKAMLAGPIPVRILRAAQFHEFVAQLVEWGRQGDVSYVPKMQTQLVAARPVAEVLADLALDPKLVSAGAPIVEIAGPRAENLADVAAMLVARREDRLRIETASTPDDPDSKLYESGALLPGPDAILVGPTFEEWLQTASFE